MKLKLSVVLYSLDKNGKENEKLHTLSYTFDRATVREGAFNLKCGMGEYLRKIINKRFGEMLPTIRKVFREEYKSKYSNVGYEEDPT
jgi:hypothetical protein